MFKFVKITVTAIFFSLVISIPVNAAKTVKIGYVDLQAVINLSKAGKKEQEKIKDFIKERQKKIAAEEKKLEAAGKKFEKDLLTMSKEQQDKKKLAFRKLARDSEKEVKQKESLFTKRALAELKSIVAAIAKEKEFTFIVEKSEGAVLYSQEGMDITDSVMKEFDKKFAK